MAKEFNLLFILHNHDTDKVISEKCSIVANSRDDAIERYCTTLGYDGWHLVDVKDRFVQPKTEVLPCTEMPF